LAIARIILKNPSILVLDEATSSLDSKTEVEIQKQFDDISKGRTTLVVAHKLRSIVDSDNIIVLKNGEVVEQGTHGELLSLEGEYFGMWNAQIKMSGDDEYDSPKKENFSSELFDLQELSGSQ